jgi:hypothetical protein
MQDECVQAESGARLKQLGNQASPPRLVRGADSAAVVAVEVLVELEEVSEMRVVLQEAARAVEGPLAVRIPGKDGDQSALQLIGHLQERHVAA